jgi:2-dehydropantoate 2-reductase
VTLVARGNNLRALQAKGLTLVESDGTSATHRLRAVASAAEAGEHDLVVLATKAHQVAAIVDDLAFLYHRETVVVPMQNGIPWWYFHGRPGPHHGRAVESVDPGGFIAARIPVDRVLGCVVYPACDLPEPGVVRHVEGDRFPVGELDGSLSRRAQSVSLLFESAGLRSPILPDVRSEIWLKLWRNLSLNPVSALTRATLAQICTQPASRALVAGMMAEAQAVAEALGVTFRVSLERRIEGAARVGNHRTSMLQDVEAGRTTELDALLGSVIELARLVEIPVPRLESVYACAWMLERTVCSAGPGLATAPAAPFPVEKAA